MKCRFCKRDLPLGRTVCTPCIIESACGEYKDTSMADMARRMWPEEIAEYERRRIT